MAAPDFYELALKSLTQQESDSEKRSFLESRFPAVAMRANGYNQQTTGFNVYQQGYVQSGQTLQSSAAYAVQAVDVNGLVHEAQRLADRVLGASEAATAGAQQLVQTAVDGNSKAAQITASASVAEAAIRAANPPVTQTQVYETKPAAPQQQYDRAPPPPPQAAPHTGDSGSINSALYGRIALASCVKCHSGQSPKANLDLSLAALKSMGPEERADLAGKIANRISSDDPEKRMPRGQPPLLPKMRDGLLAIISQ